MCQTSYGREKLHGQNRTKPGTYPEPVLGTGMGEVDTQLKGFVVEGFQCEQHVVDQQVPVDLPHPAQHRLTNVMHASLGLIYTG